MRARYLPAICLGLAIGLSAPPPAAAQGPKGAYVRAETWEQTATSIPSGLWLQPAGIDLTPSGKVVTTDSALRRVEVVAADGTPIGAFGRGPSPQDLTTPGHVAVDEARDRVYVCDPGAGRVAVYSLGGTRIGLWPGIGGPAGIAVAPDGRVVVTDGDGDRVRLFAPDGTEVGGWGGTGAGSTQLAQPAGVHVTPDGTVWVADRGNYRLVATTLDGQPVETLRLTAPSVADIEPLDIAADGDNLWLATESGLVRFDIRSRALRSHLEGATASAVTLSAKYGMYATVDPLEGSPGVWHYLYRQASGDPDARWGSALLVPGYFDGLETITIAADGKAYLLDVPPRIQRLALTGLVEQQIEAPDPVEVDADPSGRVYAVAGEKVYAFEADGTPRWDTRIRDLAPGTEVDATGIAWDESSGQLVVLDAGGSRFHFLSDAGELLNDWPLRGVEPSRDYWTDMVVASDGTRYALDAGGSQIRAWDGVNRLVLELDLSEPARRFDVASDGTVFVLSHGGWARRLARDGSAMAEWDVTRLDRGRDSAPVDIAVDSAGKVYVVDGGANVVTIYAWDPDATPTEPPEVDEGCEVIADKLAQPTEVMLGDAVEVSLVIRGECAGDQGAADIALLIDTSMDRGAFKAARRAAEHFLDLIDPSADQVAIVESDADLLTNDLHYLRRALRRLEQSEEYVPSIEAAERVLFGRRARLGVKKVVIVLMGSQLSDEMTWWQRYRIERAAGQVQRRGAEVFAIAFGRRTDERLMQDIASSRSHVYHSKGTWQIDDIYERIADRIRPTMLMTDLTLTDELPANMAYVVGSAEPPATVTGNQLVWHIGAVPLTGTGVRFAIRPQEPGEWPTNERAWGEYIDATGAAGTIDFPIPVVRVGAPTPTPQPTPIATETSAASPTIPATSTPEATPTRRPRAVYLPVALRNICTTGHADVALVLDASTSMLGSTGSGRVRLEAATEAAGGFLDLLDLTLDQAAVVTFNNRARVLQALTGDRAALDAALAAIGVEQESRIDVGISAASRELQSERRRGSNQAAMIVLTDGRANPTSPQAAVLEANRAKAAGITVFTIGLGDDLDFAALRAMASRDDYFFHSPDAEDLAAIYAVIASAIPCPPDEQWPQ